MTGMLVRRWGLLWRPISLDYKRVPDTIQALCRLHNWCQSKNIKISKNTGTYYKPGDNPVPVTIGELNQPEQGGKRRDLEV